jgi:hypothetical protein
MGGSERASRSRAGRTRSTKRLDAPFKINFVVTGPAVQGTITYAGLAPGSGPLSVRRCRTQVKCHRLGTSQHNSRGSAGDRPLVRRTSMKHNLFPRGRDIGERQRIYGLMLKINPRLRALHTPFWMAMGEGTVRLGSRRWSAGVFYESK